MTASGVKQCRCPPQFEGAQCQENKCSRCQEGKCSINKQNGEVSCMYVPGLVNSKGGRGVGWARRPKKELVSCGRIIRARPRLRGAGSVIGVWLLKGSSDRWEPSG